MSPAQQAAALPIEALKFSASFADKLTGGASSVRRSEGAEPGAADDEASAGSGPIVASSVISEVVTYDPRVMHKTDPWKRALVNDQGFALESKVCSLIHGCEGVWIVDGCGCDDVAACCVSHLSFLLAAPGQLLLASMTYAFRVQYMLIHVDSIC